jgi:hypothetical protein
LQYVVVEFADHSVHALPTTWLDEEEAELVAFWPPKDWSEAKIRKAIETCEARGVDWLKEENIRVLHSYSE